jgi:hypothetical protein
MMTQYINTTLMPVENNEHRFRVVRIPASCSEGPWVNLGPETGCPDCGFPWLYSVPPSKCCDSASYWATAASIHILFS